MTKSKKQGRSLTGSAKRYPYETVIDPKTGKPLINPKTGKPVKAQVMVD